MGRKVQGEHGTGRWTTCILMLIHSSEGVFKLVVGIQGLKNKLKPSLKKRPYDTTVRDPVCRNNGDANQFLNCLMTPISEILLIGTMGMQMATI